MSHDQASKNLADAVKDTVSSVANAIHHVVTGGGINPADIVVPAVAVTAK